MFPLDVKRVIFGASGYPYTPLAKRCAIRFPCLISQWMRTRSCEVTLESSGTWTCKARRTDSRPFAPVARIHSGTNSGAARSARGTSAGLAQSARAFLVPPLNVCRRTGFWKEHLAGRQYHSTYMGEGLISEARSVPRPHPFRLRCDCSFGTLCGRPGCVPEVSGATRSQVRLH